MIEVINTLPDYTAGFHAGGRVTAKQYEHIVAPVLQHKFKTFSQINMLYDLDDDLDIYDFKTMWVSSIDGWRNYHRWHHVALVTDKFWIQNSLKFCSFFTPKYMRVFYKEEKNYALKWVKAS